MNDREIRISQMATRIRDFGEAHTGDFPAASRGSQKFAALSTLVADIEQLGTEQVSTSGAAQRNTMVKKGARENIRGQMKAIRDTAAALESEQPGISRSFRMPPTNGNEALVNFARAFVEAATPLKSLFTSNELPASFLEDLTAAVAEFEQGVSLHNQRRAESAAATASLKNSLAGINRLKAELDPIVRNKFRDDPAMLAAWGSASRIERAPRRATVPATPAASKP